MAEIVKRTFDTISTISDKTVLFCKNSLNIFTDIIINGIKFKNSTGQYDEYYYYKYINVILITLVFGVIYYLHSYHNLFGVKNTKYSILGTVILFSIGILYFLFLVFRNNNNNKINSDDRPRLYTTATDKSLSSKHYSDEDYSIDNESIKNTYLTPLKRLSMYVGLLFFILLTIIYIVNYILFSQKNTNAFSITQSVISITIVLVILAILASLLSIKSNASDDTCENSDTNTITSFIYKYICIIKKIIFFIPCLLVIAIDEINKDIKLTPKSVYLLLFILLLLITLLFLLPFLFTYFRTMNKSSLLKGSGPYYLNELKVIGIYQNLNKNVNSTIDIAIPEIERQSNSIIKNPIDALLGTLNLDKQENTIFKTYDSSTQIGVEDKEITKQTEENISDTKGYNFKLLKNDYNGIYNIKTSFHDPPKSRNKFPYTYTYSISFYVFINPQPTNTSIAYTKDTEIFNYAYKPVIYYNGKSQSIIIKSRTLNNKGDQLDTIYEGKNIKHQKWVFIVINYDNNNIDVFIDGKLVGSKKDVTPYFKGDKVTIGENQGIHGSIKEISYYDTIKSPQTVELLYNLTKNK
jgi:protein-S-isoprenylcysteine O-methyltransferase Ste14